MNDRRLQGSTCLVVGGAGFVGSNLVRHLLDQEVSRVVVVDNLLSSVAWNIPDDERVDIRFGSGADRHLIGNLPTDIDFAWHLACYHGNQSSIFDPVADHDNNLLPALVVFDHLSRMENLQSVVYSAAGCAVAEKTYDAPAATDEDAPVTLFHDSPYSISKITGEMYGNYYFRQFDLPFVRARFQNVYGPGEVLGAGSWRGTPATVWRNVVPTFIWRALHDQELRLDNGGQTGRDFIFVDDICRGLIACATRGKAGEAYNLASGSETTIKELASVILDATASGSALVEGPPRPWDHSGRRYGSPEKSRRELDFETQVDLKDGIERTVSWTKGNESGIAAAIASHARFMTSASGS